MSKITRFSRRRAIWCLAAGALALVAGSAPALADPLDAPRASGLVGERFDGFAVVRDPNASGDVKALVNEINAKRRAFYDQTAEQQNTTTVAVGKIYANKIFEKAPRGYWFLTSTGQWRQK